MRKALVIGASGGIGSALADRLDARGDLVDCVSRQGTGLDLTDPARVEAVLGDLTGPYETICVATGLLSPKGRRPEKSLAEIDAAAMAEVMAVNAIGPALVLRALPRLLPRKRPARVGLLTARVGSIGDNRLGGWYSYRAAKAAANQIVHTAAIEIARTHPQAVVVSLHPGTVETPFTRNYPQHRKLAPETAATHLLNVLDGLTSDESGGFFDWTGARVPW
ncbi:SDR family NAD(P)-dependent oxidoreductase [uncultured Celeribacter sp.]|uniref:SDR family NAD(P)-dependent oxidoreductase n=1 Tax=uncultured Celeribacter sp. TaxID=1303376 RepID=UPI002AA9437C|nr:SDR family NAD(P)-dependent oxidoreductase [uncultured Celeribacter sp.]